MKDTDIYVPRHLSIYRRFSSMLVRHIDEEHYFFYVIQVVYYKRFYYLYRRWGRLYERGKIEWKSSTPQNVIGEFQRIFFEKTHNKWGEKFVYRRQYCPVEVSMGGGRSPFPSLCRYIFPKGFPLGIPSTKMLEEAQRSTDPHHQRCLLPIFLNLDIDVVIRAAAMIVKDCYFDLIAAETLLPQYQEIEVPTTFVPQTAWRAWRFRLPHLKGGRLFVTSHTRLFTDPSEWEKVVLQEGLKEDMNPQRVEGILALLVEAVSPIPLSEGEWRIPTMENYQVIGIVQSI